MKKKNILWNFFASVKLALFTLCCLAVTSIIGTLIPQKEAADYYIQNFGPKTAQFFQILDITDMYNSWWFLALLGLLSTNLIVCSIDRFPHVLHQIRQDNLSVPLEKLLKMGKSQIIPVTTDSEQTTTSLSSILTEHGWKTEQRSVDNTSVLFTQKGAWSRLGAYLVHASILVIFLGAIYGQFTGFKGSIMLPELQSSGEVYSYGDGKPIQLGFQIRCDRFDIEFYSNNAPKEYTSDLVVLQDGKEILRKSIEVNDPLKYKGITFYQSSYQGFRDFIITISEENTGEKIFQSQYQKEVVWQEKDVRFGIINLEAIRDRVARLKIWFSDAGGEPSIFWMDAGEQVKIKRPEKEYLFSAKQQYATGLQVAKDPGVWIVYIGCGLMLVGLYLAFFMSHRRIWFIVQKEEDKTVIQMRGSSNKNKTGFDTVFVNLADTIRKSL